ncbi:O-antigen ligase family protein [Halorubrum rubrum]|uniref:O-antigen ligase family protein n=2 Tax=Halorubrum rubrum TaxID=1126240 RepID=A0ABD5R4E2_9EURY
MRENTGFLILIAIFFIALLLPNSTLPQLIGYIAAALLYTFVLCYTLPRDTIMVIPNWVAATLTVIFLIAFYHLVATPRLGIVTRTIAFFGLIFTNLVYLPRIIPERYFFAMFARLSTVIVCIGFIPLIGPTAIFGFDLSLWPYQASVVSIQFNAITSIFSNPNVLGFLSLIGTICAAVEYRLYDTQLSIGLFGVSLMGLIFTDYIGGWLVLIALVILWLSYQIWGRSGVLGTTFVGGVCGVVILAVVFDLLPGPYILQSQDLSNRKPLWLAGAAAFSQNPILGTGFGTADLMMEPFLDRLEGYSPHNSFLRMFIETGLIGGGAYLSIHVLAITQTARAITDERSFFLFGFVVIAVITQMFETFSIFGLSMRSTIVTLGIGYAIHNITIQRSEVRTGSHKME